MKKDIFTSWTKEKIRRCMNLKTFISHVIINLVKTNFERNSKNYSWQTSSQSEIKTFNKTSHAINKISHAINRIFHAVNSEIIISRTFSARKIRYSRNALITHKIIPRVINSEKFSETIIFIFTSIRNSENLRNIAKFLQWFVLFIIIEKPLHSSFKEEVNSHTIVLNPFSEILPVTIIEAIL
jgi:hypothetical protein